MTSTDSLTPADLDRAALVEVMARAIHDCEQPFVRALNWEAMDMPFQDAWRKLATAALAAYEAHMAERGMMSVPREPTPEMCQAAHSALYRWRETVAKDPQQDPMNSEKHAIRYRAMLAAATTQKEPGT